MSDSDPLYPNPYQSDATFVALPATLWTGGPAPNCAAQGALIQATVVSVSGPTGGELGLWEENEDATETTRRFVVPVGTTNGTSRFSVSQGISSPEPDPFGHIHGRRFTANRPGLYVVGFQLTDTSTRGLNGGPIHTPSVTNYFYFQAGLCVDSISKTNNSTLVRFGAKQFTNYVLEASHDLSPSSWFVVSSYTGNFHSHIQILTDPIVPSPSRYYRLRAIPQ